MNKTLFTLLLFAAALSISAQKHIDYDYCPYNDWVKTLKFNVLDINLEKNILAFKHVYELQPQYTFDNADEKEMFPIDCGYAGMESQPRAGVVLGIFDLEKGKYLKTFTIYESCYEKNECYKHELSIQRLDSAKQMFEKYNLDYTKKEKPVLFSGKSNKNECHLNTGGINFSSSYNNDYDQILTLSYLYADEKLIWQTEHDDSFVMGSHGEVTYKAAYKKGDKIIFLIKFYHTHNMEGPKSFEFHYFSPVYTLKDGKITSD